MPAGKMFKEKRKKIMPMVSTAIEALMPGAFAGKRIAPAIGRQLGPSNPVTPLEEPDYPTSAPSFSKRPQARPKPMKPRARPARIEQEAAEAAAVERGNNEARRRASDTQNFYEGGSVRGVKSVQSSGKGFSGTY